MRTGLHGVQALEGFGFLMEDIFAKSNSPTCIEFKFAGKNFSNILNAELLSSFEYIKS